LSTDGGTLGSKFKETVAENRDQSHRSRQNQNESHSGADMGWTGKQNSLSTLTNNPF
jgi:hypothetical protein